MVHYTIGNQKYRRSIIWITRGHRKNIYIAIFAQQYYVGQLSERGLQSKLLDFGLARTDNHDQHDSKLHVLGSPIYEP